MWEAIVVSRAEVGTKPRTPPPPPRTHTHTCTRQPTKQQRPKLHSPCAPPEPVPHQLPHEAAEVDGNPLQPFQAGYVRASRQHT